VPIRHCEQLRESPGTTTEVLGDLEPGGVANGDNEIGIDAEFSGGYHCPSACGDVQSNAVIVTTITAVTDSWPPPPVLFSCRDFNQDIGSAKITGNPLAPKRGAHDGEATLESALKTAIPSLLSAWCNGALTALNVAE
jgi:hypothetical protein